MAGSPQKGPARLREVHGVATLVVENLVALERKSDFKKNTDCEFGSADAVGAEQHLKVEPIARAISALFAGFNPMLAAAVGVASAAFAVPPAALAEAPGASTPTQVASPPAASVTDADKRVVADLLFKRLLLKPDDLDAGFQYSQLETELGDYEAAIGALERILYYNPDLPRVKLQLGMLYFHLRSYEMARNCFEAVLNAPDVPADIRTEVQTYVAAVDKALAINPRSMPGCPIVSQRLRSRIRARCGRSRPRLDFPTAVMRYRT
jgi:tetratricopeptide (TPR) repeat protein